MKSGDNNIWTASLLLQNRRAVHLSMYWVMHAKDSPNIFEVSVSSLAFVCISPFSTEAELQICIAHKQIPNNWLTDHAHFHHFTNQLHSHQRHNVHTLHCCFALCFIFSRSLTSVSLCQSTTTIYALSISLTFQCNVCEFRWLYVGYTKFYWDMLYQTKGANENRNWQNHRFLNEAESRHWKARVFLRMERKHIRRWA